MQTEQHRELYQLTCRLENSSYGQEVNGCRRCGHPETQSVGSSSVCRFAPDARVILQHYTAMILQDAMEQQTDPFSFRPFRKSMKANVFRSPQFSDDTCTRTANGIVKTTRAVQ